MFIDLWEINQVLQDISMSKIRKKWKLVHLIDGLNPSVALDLVERFGNNIR